jgi:uncharacterized membrane protein YccC
MTETAEARKCRTDGLPGRIERLGGRMAKLRKIIPLRQRMEGGLEQGVLSAAAAVAAYLPTQALGLKEGFWGAITAVAVVQTDRGAARSSGRDQCTGAAVGGVIGVGVAFVTGPLLLGYALAVVLSVLVCWFLNVASASRLSGITATIILLVPHTGTPQHMLTSRVSEVAWGVLVALTLVWARERFLKR